MIYQQDENRVKSRKIEVFNGPKTLPLKLKIFTTEKNNNGHRKIHTRWCTEAAPMIKQLWCEFRMPHLIICL